MVDFAVDEEVEGSPDDGEIVVDADERVVNALFDLGGRLRGAGAAYTVCEGFGGHLAWIAVAHENHGCAGDEGCFDGCGVAPGHAVEHGIDGSKDGFFFRGLRLKCGDCNEQQSQAEGAKSFHGCRFYPEGVGSRE